MTAVKDAFVVDVYADLKLVFMAVGIILIYTIVILSSCSPIHLRVWVAIVGLLTIGISYAASYSICGIAGWQTASIHSLLSFILLCIGVDDMYVISNALDQTDFNLSIEERFKITFYNAGTNVSVTTATNIVSFAISTIANTIALQSFCIYATVAVLYAWLTVMTTYSCVLVWDT